MRQVPYHLQPHSYQNESVAAINNVSSALSATGAAMLSGTADSATYADLSTACDSWVQNLSEVGYFTNLNQELLANPAIAIESALDSSIIADATSMANSMGFSVYSASALQGYLESYQQSLSPELVTSYATQGTMVQTQSAISALILSLDGGKLPLSEKSPALQSSPLYAKGGSDGGGDCEAFFWLAIIAGLTRDIILVALVAIGSHWEGCS
jgi:hypothetical protein